MQSQNIFIRKTFIYFIILMLFINFRTIAGENKTTSNGQKTEIQKTAHILSAFFLLFDRGPIYRFVGEYSKKEKHFFQANNISETKLFINYSRYELKSNFVNHLASEIIPQFEQYYLQLPIQHARVMDYYVEIFKVRAKVDFIVSTDEQEQFLLSWETRSPFHFLNQNDRYLQRIKNIPLFLSSINRTTHLILFPRQPIKKTTQQVQPIETLNIQQNGIQHKKTKIKFTPANQKFSLILNSFLALFKRGPSYDFKEEYSIQEINFLKDHQMTENQIFMNYCKYFDSKRPTVSVDILNSSLHYIYKQNLYLEHAKVYDEFILLFESYLLDRKQALTTSQLAYIKKWDRRSVTYFTEKLSRLLKNESFVQLLSMKSRNILRAARLIFYSKKEYARVLNEFISLKESYPNYAKDQYAHYSNAELAFYRKWSLLPPSESRIYNIFAYYKKYPDFINELNERSLNILFPHLKNELTIQLKEHIRLLASFKHPYLIDQASNIDRNIISNYTVDIYQNFILLLEEEISAKESSINLLKRDTTLNRQTTLIYHYRNELNHLRDIKIITVETISLLEDHIDQNMTIYPPNNCEVSLKEIYLIPPD